MTALLAVVPWWGRLLVLLAFAASLTGYGYVKGLHHAEAAEHVRDAARTTAENTAILKRVSDNKALAAKQEAEKQTLKKGYQDEIDAANATANRNKPAGLRISAAICNSAAGSTKSQGSSGGNVPTAGTVILPENIGVDLRALMLQADKVVASCRVAQEFIKSEGMAP